MTEPTTDAGRRAQEAMRILLDTHARPVLATLDMFRAIDAIDIAAIEREAMMAYAPLLDEAVLETVREAMADDNLGAAWSEAEASLREDWWGPTLEHWVLVVSTSYAAYATNRRNHRRVIEHGSTPAEALRNLAAKLRETK